MNNFSETFFVICLTRVQKMLIFKYNFKIRDMYSLDCKYYDEEFDTIDELLDDVVSGGMDPGYEITKNGVGTGELIVELIRF